MEPRHDMDVLCLDVGYSTTRMGYWTDGGIDSYRRIGTPQKRDADAAGLDPDGLQRRWLQHLSDLVRRAVQERPVDAVAISFAGVVSASDGLDRANSIWGTATGSLSLQAIADAVRHPVVVMNDLTAACYRYGLDPAFSGSQKLVAVSISSGIGAKTFVRSAGGVVLEEKGRNGEIGFIIVDDSPDAYATKAGLYKGSLGQYASGIGFSRLIRDMATGSHAAQYASSTLQDLIAVDGEHVATISRQELNVRAARAARMGDGFARAALGRSTDMLAKAIHALVLYDAPDTIVLCGGFALAVGELYRELLVDGVARRFSLLYSRDDIESMIVMGADDDLDNLIGAGRASAVAGGRPAGGAFLARPRAYA